MGRWSRSTDLQFQDNSRLNDNDYDDDNNNGEGDGDNRRPLKRTAYDNNDFQYEEYECEADEIAAIHARQRKLLETSS